MKTTKLFLSMGAATLSIVAFAATKVTKKFTQVTSARIENVGTSTGSTATVANLDGTHFTTNSASAFTVWLVTAGIGKTKLGTLVTFTNGTNKVFYH